MLEPIFYFYFIILYIFYIFIIFIYLVYCRYLFGTAMNSFAWVKMADTKIIGMLPPFLFESKVLLKITGLLQLLQILSVGAINGMRW